MTMKLYTVPIICMATFAYSVNTMLVSAFSTTSSPLRDVGESRMYIKQELATKSRYFDVCHQRNIPSRKILSPYTTNTRICATNNNYNEQPQQNDDDDNDDEKQLNLTPVLNKKKKDNNKLQTDSWRDYLPPPPEDQFTVAGDIAVLFVYAFSSHFMNNFITERVIETSDTINDAVHTLDPLGEVVTLKLPVWVDAAHSSNVVDQVYTLQAQQSLLSHWGPLFSTAGVACVSLCTCWLISGYIHQSFLFRHTFDCSTTNVLQKTMQTWITTVVLLSFVTLGFNEIVHTMPSLQQWLGCASCQDYLFTKADGMFIVDSLTVLIAWRFIISSMLGYGK